MRILFGRDGPRLLNVRALAFPGGAQGGFGFAEVEVEPEDDEDDEDADDGGVEVVGVGEDVGPVGLEFIAEVEEEGVVEGGAEEGVEGEFEEVHFGDAGGDGDEVADDG